MTTGSNKLGPTILWTTLKGKKVKTNDGRELGEIKQISENCMHVEKGMIHKVSGYQSILLTRLTVKPYGF